MYAEYDECMLCPRKCAAHRNNGVKGYCRENNTVKIGRASLHYWEEPCISGKSGSGTVFFSGCSLKCIYCQNHTLSRGERGQEVSVDMLCDIFLNLQSMGAHNINLVTAEHFAPQVCDAVISAKKKGLFIPIVLNSSGYVSEITLEYFRDIVDVYLVDFKYMNSSLAKEYSFAENYADVAKKALDKMVLYRNTLCFDEDFMLKSGVIVRHLCLPGCVQDSKDVIKYVYEKYADKIRLSIMNQYTPMPECKNHKLLCRKLTEKEYEEIIDYCIDIGIEDAYIQEGETASESFIPEFM